MQIPNHAPLRPRDLGQRGEAPRATPAGATGDLPAARATSTGLAEGAAWLTSLRRWGRGRPTAR